jgi:NAD(P)-dependent dehydrogenase (short-subunit alcohol dehydrogenase family)
MKVVLMDSSFADKVALVTGAGGGIGLASAQAFAQAGASVVIADVNADAAQAAAKSLTEGGYKAIGVKCDVADESEVEVMVDSAVHAFGRLDFAFNNAGIHVVQAETADVDADDFDRVIAVNLRGVFNCMKHELRAMLKFGAGAIVNCSSQSGFVGIAGLGAYTASKHGVIGLTKAAALEYASKGIRINAICPGTTETPLIAGLKEKEPGRLDAVIADIPLGRMGRPEEIASAVLWLCSPGAGFMIGQTVMPDGGYCAR